MPQIDAFTFSLASPPESVFMELRKAFLGSSHLPPDFELFERFDPFVPKFSPNLVYDAVVVWWFVAGNRQLELFCVLGLHLKLQISHVQSWVGARYPKVWLWKKGEKGGFQPIGGGIKFPCVWFAATNVCRRRRRLSSLLTHSGAVNCVGLSLCGQRSFWC